MNLTTQAFLTSWACENLRLRPLHDLKLILMSDICHDPDFKYIIALNRLMTCLFPLNSANLSFRDSVGRAKPNGVRKGANERREEREWMKTPTEATHRLRSGPFLFGTRNYLFRSFSCPSCSHLNFSLRKTWFKFRCKLLHWFIVRSIKTKLLQESCWALSGQPDYNLTDFKILGSTSNRAFYF